MAACDVLTYHPQPQRSADGCLIPIQASEDATYSHHVATTGFVHRIEDLSKQMKQLEVDCPVSSCQRDSSRVLAISSSQKEQDPSLLKSSRKMLIRKQVNSKQKHSATESNPPPPASYPEYNNVVLRRHTFVYPQQRGNSWPHSEDVQSIENLVRNGFFYTGIGDLARCYQCGIGLKDWISEDDPLYVHLKFSPNCHHIMTNIDSNLVHIYQRHISEENTSPSQQNVLSSLTNDIPSKHPEYKSYDVRLASYWNWSRDHRQTPQQLAQAGFFHTGLRDVVRCYSCGGGMQSWDSGDEPWIEHARWFPDCPHVRAVKGDDFVRLVQASVEQQDGNSGDDDGDDEMTTRTFPLMSKASINVMKMGYSRAVVAMAIDECRTNDIKITSDNLLNVLFEKQDKGVTLPSDVSQQESQSLPESKGSTKQDLMAEREILKRRLMCYVCKDKECNVLFLPCGHHKVCETCSRDVERCVLCDVKILQKVKTFMS